jgi:hypothetical protein
MRALRSQKSSPVSSSAVSETVRRVNAQALALLSRRAEINRRIHCLHRVVQGLRDLATSKGCDARDAVSTHAANPVQSRGTASPGDCSSPLDPNVGRMGAEVALQPRLMIAGLGRACRIALMEADGAASVDEIRSRIVRRGSFVFSDSGFANMAIARTLNIMKDNGEIHVVKSGNQYHNKNQTLWQRAQPSKEIED